MLTVGSDVAGTAVGPFKYHGIQVTSIGMTVIGKTVT